MAGRLNKQAFEKLIAANLTWLEAQPRTLERDHVIEIVRESVAYHYAPTVPERAVSVRLYVAYNSLSRLAELFGLPVHLDEPVGHPLPNIADLHEAVRALLSDRSDWQRAETIVARLNTAKQALSARVRRMVSDEAPRAGGDVECARCGLTYCEHPPDPVESFLTILCDGRRVKL